MNIKSSVSTLLGLLVAICALWYGYSSWQSYRPNTSSPRQAIFLGDGQIYFGYASSLRNQVVTLSDVYVLLPSPETTDKTAPAQSAKKVDLVKLGIGGDNDIIWSEDKMEINRDAIKYVEVMKEDSQINLKIKEYQNKK